MSIVLKSELFRIRGRIHKLNYSIAVLRAEVTNEDLQAFRDRFREEPGLGAVIKPGSSLSTSWLAQGIFSDTERVIAELVSQRMRRDQLEARRDEIRRLLETKRK